MKHKLLLIILVVITISSSGQAPPRLIVRGDDMGYAHGGNIALIKCSREGIQTSIEVIVPSPWFPEAVSMLNANPGIDVGVHLALTSEWDNVKWRPLTTAGSLRDELGYFFPMIYPNPAYPGRALKENKWQLAEVEAEFRAQIETAKKHIPQISHVSAHMGCSRITDEVRTLTKKLSIEYGVDIDLSEYAVTSVGYDGPHGTAAEKAESFLKMLSKLERDKTYLFVDHPGIDNEELRGIHHIGYENVAADRQGVTDLFTNKKVRERIKELGIELISYRDLIAR
jgi:predicted glycoside hydrolase/deacetylase ChbG (UPF0249 family)